MIYIGLAISHERKDSHFRLRFFNHGAAVHVESAIDSCPRRSDQSRRTKEYFSGWRYSTGCIPPVGNAPEYPRVFIRLICFVALGVIERGVARSSRRVSAPPRTCVRAVLSEPNFVWKPFKTSWPSGYFTKEEGPHICLWVRRDRAHVRAHTRHRDRGGS